MYPSSPQGEQILNIAQPLQASKIEQYAGDFLAGSPDFQSSQFPEAPALGPANLGFATPDLFNMGVGTNLSHLLNPLGNSDVGGYSNRSQHMPTELTDIPSLSNVPSQLSVMPDIQRHMHQQANGPSMSTITLPQVAQSPGGNSATPTRRFKPRRPARHIRYVRISTFPATCPKFPPVL